MARIAHIICEANAQINFAQNRRGVGDDTNAVVLSGAVSPRTHRRPLYGSIHFLFTNKVDCAPATDVDRESRSGIATVSGGFMGIRL